MTIWFTVQLDDRPGALAQVANALAERGVNITGIVGVAEDTDGALMLTTSDPVATRDAFAGLGIAFEDGPRLVVIGSSMGRPEEPAWVGNLQAHPETRVRVGRDVRSMLARVAEGVERERLWSLAASGYPGYEDYARWTSRTIPVVVLEPLDREGAA